MGPPRYLHEAGEPDAPDAPDPDWMAEARAMHGLPRLETLAAARPNAADPDQTRAAQRVHRLSERAVAVTIHEMMQLAEVRAVIYRWLAKCGAFRAHDFPAGLSIDPLQLARNAAHREVVQAITSDLLGAAPTEYLLMLKEASDV